ncbi:SDR family NAD(P)-dependent oxidoreductase [Tunturiibacter psychrotolerans]|uniref:SDR family NAD(P)-dependent oxidoreductase n=1 Tax=Tunturiibacter psychrotolerans TaxID=3069686 RepID=UPI003D242213
MHRLKAKVALVTGASMGFGAAIARRMGLEGADVIVNYPSNKIEADKVVSDIVASGGRAISLRADITKRDEVQIMLSESVKAFGPLDILVNNAGAYEFLPLEAITEEHFHNLFDLNVLGTIFVTQAAIPYFKRTGGSVVNISSVVSVCPSELGPVYSATKGAIDALTKSLAKAHASRQIRFNTLNPGLTPTEGVRSLGEMGRVMLNDILRQTPLGRNGSVEDVAAAAVFFASDESSFITGESLLVSGGRR